MASVKKIVKKSSLICWNTSGVALGMWIKGIYIGLK